MLHTPSIQPVRRARTVAVLALAALLVLPALARAASPPNTLGVYAGAGNPASVARFETNLGRPVATVHDALARENWANLSNPTWFVNQWNASAYRQRVMYSVPMLPDSGGTLAEGAKGTYNAYFRTLAQRFVAAGAGSAVLRIGPEFNGFWFRWSITAANSGASYAAFWRQIVTTMRAVPGANFKFDWCANNGSSWVNGQQLQAESAYPGDAYVDYIGLDVYDQSWGPNHTSPAGRWSELFYQRNGLRWHRDFAAAHGKPMTFPEWGLANRADGYGGGDAPYFIEQMYEWIRTNDVAYHMYFEHTDGSGDYSLFTGWAPNASRRFVELFGPGSTGGPLIPPGALTPSAAASPAIAGDAGAAGAVGDAGDAGAVAVQQQPVAAGALSAPLISPAPAPEVTPAPAPAGGAGGVPATSKAPPAKAKRRTCAKGSRAARSCSTRRTRSARGATKRAARRRAGAKRRRRS